MRVYDFLLTNDHRNSVGLQFSQSRIRGQVNYVEERSDGLNGTKGAKEWVSKRGAI